MFRRTVSRPVCLGVRQPFGTRDQFFFPFLIIFIQLQVCYCGAPFLTRGWVCSFQLLLGLVSAVFLGSESSRTHEHILVSQFLGLSQPRRPGSCIYFPQEQGSLVIPPGIGFILTRLLVLVTQTRRGSRENTSSIVAYSLVTGKMCPQSRSPARLKPQVRLMNSLTLSCSMFTTCLNTP
jgi:hypothetical protein